SEGDARLELDGDDERREAGGRDDPADQDRLGAGMVVECRAREPGVAMEVALAPDLGPGRIDAEADDRQQQVDDPDPKVLAARSREDDRTQPPAGTRRGAPARGPARKPLHPPCPGLAQEMPARTLRVVSTMRSMCSASRTS